MPALVAGIHVFTALRCGKDVDGRNKSGHDVERIVVRFDRDML
jgi:hypothetical protein